MTKRRGDWDVDVCVVTGKLKRPNEDKVRLMLSTVAEKTSSLTSASAAASAPATLSADDKTLRPVDLNRQMSTQNVGDLHERVCRENPMPAALVDKMVAFHFGQLTLTMENLTQYYLYLESRFRKFAHSVHAFQSLGAEDQDILLTSNAPFYFQVDSFCLFSKNGA